MKFVKIFFIICGMGSITEGRGGALRTRRETRRALHTRRTTRTHDAPIRSNNSRTKTGEIHAHTHTQINKHSQNKNKKNQTNSKRDVVIVDEMDE